MRGKWDHKAPEDHQEEPRDNTSPYVFRQVRSWARGQLALAHPGLPIGNTGDTRLIHPEVAMEIAAWFHAPSAEALTAFSHSGTITDGLADEIQGELDVALRQDNKDALAALLAYVTASYVTPWAVGKNMAGYMPESDVSLHLDYAEAVQAYDALLDGAPEEVSRSDECECAEDGTGELCESCAVEALVASYRRDDMPSVVNGKVFGDEEPLGLLISAESWAGSMSYWLSHGEPMTYGDYLTQRDE